MEPSRILIVEDEIIVAKDIELKLKKMGHEPIGMVATGEDAVREALQKKPDMILMDIKLGGKMDGVDAAGLIHAQSQIPLIYLTALNDEYTLQRAKITEPFAYIQKPITTRELHIAVEIALYKHQVQKQLSMQLQHMTAMRLIDQAIINSHDLHWTMQVVLHQIAIQLEIDAAAIMLLSPYSNLLEYFQWYGFRSTGHTHIYMRRDQGFIGQSFNKGGRFYVPNLRNIPPDEDERISWMLTEDFCSYLCIPLYSKDKLLGILEVFTRKPIKIDPEWSEFLGTLAQQAAIAIENISLITELSSANVEIVQSYNATILGLSAALELRDDDTQGHSLRVTELTLRLARELGIGGEQLDHIRRGALLHDFGKVGIPDHILHKPGALSPEEWVIMKRHPVLAQEILSSVPFLRPALEIPLYHHERWDGSGYPYGLKGEKIPLSARIFAVVDVWDALLSNRPYRTAWEREKALEYIRDQAGKLFDPDIVDIFVNVIRNDPRAMPPEDKPDEAE